MRYRNGISSSIRFEAVKTAKSIYVFSLTPGLIPLLRREPNLSNRFNGFMITSYEYTMSVLLFLLISMFTTSGFCQPASAKPELTVAGIMRDPIQSVGSLPDSIRWAEDGRRVYFKWNPDFTEADSFYSVSRDGKQLNKLEPEDYQWLPTREGQYSRDRTLKLFVRNGDIYLHDIKRKKLIQVTNTVERETQPRFTYQEEAVVFRRGMNLFKIDLANGSLIQITDFREGSDPEQDAPPPSDNQRWLKQEQRRLSTVLDKRLSKKERRRKQKPVNAAHHPKTIYLAKQQLAGLQLSLDQRYVTFRLSQSEDNRFSTEVPNYVAEDGYTEMLPARPKVGSPPPSFKFGIYDLVHDTVYYARTDSIPGIMDPVPAETSADSGQGEAKARSVILYGPFWSEDGQHALVVGRAWDNKDRWIMLLNPQNGALTVLDRQHDPAWIGGPGISGWVYYPGWVQWLPDNRRVCFQSE